MNEQAEINYYNWPCNVDSKDQDSTGKTRNKLENQQLVKY